MKSILLIVSWLILSACGQIEQSNTANFMSESLYERGHSDSGIKGKQTYAQIVDSLYTLNTQYPSMTEIIEYGTSEQGEALTAIVLSDPNASVSGQTPAALISGAIHGNEYLNIVDRLPAAFLRQQGNTGVKQFLGKGGRIYIVPIINPDGFDSGRRHNANGIDLNRSFPIRGANYAGIRAKETEAIRKFVRDEKTNKNMSLEIAMEYHCCIGALIEPWAYKYARPEPAVLARNQEIATAMQNNLGSSMPSGTVHQILNYPTTKGGSDDYYLENYGRRAYSYEGRFGTEAYYFDDHHAWWNDIFSLL